MVKSTENYQNVFFRAKKNFMSKNYQQGPKIIFRHEIFFPYKMTKTLSKNSQKKFEIHKKNFLSRNDFWTFLITFRQKKFFVNFEFFLWIFFKCFGHFLWKKNFMSKNDFWTFLIIFRREFFFGPKKKRFDTFRWISPFSMVFLWSQSSGFASSVRNLVRNWYFTQTHPLRLAAL